MDAPTKIGAGLLLVFDRECLLLLRAGNHNAGTWGLPGGNAEAGDNGNLLETAKREATEEMGELPAFDVVGEVLTKRGKHKQKHFTVFIAALRPGEREMYKPNLNHEHSEWRWHNITALQSSATGEALQAPPVPLHPVVEIAFREHSQQLKAALQSCAAAPL